MPDAANNSPWFTDITDESDYIESIGKKAAAEAINKARVDVAVQERMNGPFAQQAPGTHPFCIHYPEVDELSSPQVDMLFDVMVFLYQSIPAMKLMEDLRAEHVAEK